MDRKGRNLALITTLALGTTLAAIGMISCSDSPTAPPKKVEKTLKIAFASNRDGNEEIYVMNADGSNQRNLTNNAARDQAFSWSPDGSRIVFTSDRGGVFGIYSMNADGTDQKRLTQFWGDFDARPVWSPDGRRIAFASYVNGSYEIQVMNSDGTNLINVTNLPSFDFEPTWSPDGSEIAFITGDSLPDGRPWYGVNIMNADGTNRDTPIAATWIFGSLVWSPQDDLIAFWQSGWSDRQHSDICLLDHHAWRQLTSDPSLNYNPAWSPDGSKLAFVSNRDGAFEIYAMEADGTNQTRLTYSTGVLAEALCPSWTPDGSGIVFTSNQTGNFEIYIMRGFTVARLTNNDAIDVLPSCAMSP